MLLVPINQPFQADQRPNALTGDALRRTLKRSRYVYGEMGVEMQTKLTLRLEEELIEQAKSYAAQAGKSISQIVADYFKLLSAPQQQQKSPPLTQSLRGLLRNSQLDETDYRKHLEEKHL